MIQAFVMLLGLLVLITGIGLLFAFPTMWLVNYLFAATLLTKVFGVSAFSIWKAWALNFLVGMLGLRAPALSKR